ncbi:DUF2335 domain-containing protein [Gordonia phthalatica]|uniref:DUF2335 domain-containing protein n=1 Tax=Gordonia phthalatica TaxID=1136941 RepID=A0A0N7FV16_9ACTN|nr:DUF2335 domain-containing protein [Gordonia phthalatica]ALG85903.1 hypothetical protein ACH46_17185 [Gordonia phthalatica]
MPPAQEMRDYQMLIPDAAERIMRMAESQTVDRSRRQDRLVNAEIDNAKSDRSMATFFLLAFFVAAVVFFSVGNNVAGGFLLSIPVLGVVRTMWPSGRND